MQLTRRRIISVAMTLIEHDGVEAFSMARLATELGCSIMILYGYVPSRSDLLDGVTDQIFASLTAPGVQPSGWEGQVRALAAAIRQVARTFPQCATLAFGRRTPIPGSAALALASLREAGLSEQGATRVVRTVTAYVVGSVRCESGSDDADAGFEFGLSMLIGAVAALCPAAVRT